MFQPLWWEHLTTPVVFLHLSFHRGQGSCFCGAASVLSKPIFQQLWVTRCMCWFRLHCISCPCLSSSVIAALFTLTLCPTQSQDTIFCLPVWVPCFPSSFLSLAVSQRLTEALPFKNEMKMRLKANLSADWRQPSVRHCRIWNAEEMCSMADWQWKLHKIIFSVDPRKAAFWKYLLTFSLLPEPWLLWHFTPPAPPCSVV